MHHRQAMADLQLYLFGEPQLVWQERTLHPDRRKAIALLAFLAMAEQRQSRDHLAALLWPDLDQQRARAALRSTSYALAALAPGAWLEKDRATLALNRQAIRVDARDFLALLNCSRAHAHGQQPLCAECAAWLAQAVDCYRADFMGTFSLDNSAEYDDWQRVHREWLRRELGNALARLARHYGERHDFDLALDYARRWLALDPLHEPAHRMLMYLYAASGQHSEALRQYRQCAELLDAELATPPEEATTRLYAEIQSDRTPTQSVPPARSPAAAHALPPLPTLLVGRERALDDLKQRLGIRHGTMQPFTIVQGWPGVGKSTTVAALAHDPEVASHFPNGILWASLGEAPSLLSELNVWASALSLSEPGRARTIEQLTAQLIAALRDRRMLLIVDDIWRAEHLNPFMVGGSQCALVGTSRLNEVAQALAPTASDVYRLAVLADAAGMELLERLTPETVANHPEAARTLVRDLEGLPLAIQVAGRLLHTEARLGWGVGELLDELRAGARLLQADVPGDMLGLSAATTPTVAALLKRSTDALDEQTRQQFACLGLFVPKPASFDLGALAVVWDVGDPRPIARVLVNRGLLEPVGGGRFQLHALLVLHAQALLKM
jgi:DNA-binding SARP family transcriptional activator